METPLTGHGGDIVAASELTGIPADEIIDFSANINPLGPPANVREILAGSLGAVTHYPDSDCRRLRRRLAEVHALDPEHILVGNGSTELIYLLTRVLMPSRVATFAPCYLDYWRASEQVGSEVNGYIGSPDSGFLPSRETLHNAADLADLVWVGHPNNPAGWLLERTLIQTLAARHHDTVFVIDEAFTEFLQGCEAHTLLSLDMARNIVVLRSLTKFFAIPGLRLGFTVAHPDILRLLKGTKEPWSVNGPALEIGERLYDDADYFLRTRAVIARERQFLAQELGAICGLKPFGSRGCFILARITSPGLTAARLKERLLKKRILIRDASNFRGLDSSYVRFAVRGHDDNEKLIAVLRGALSAEEEADEKGDMLLSPGRV